MNRSSSLRVTVCQLPNDPDAFERAWQSLVSHTRDQRSDLVLLPEMPFSAWLASTPTVDAEAWRVAMDAHDRWLARLGELGVATVLTSQPTTEDGQRYNQAVVWQRTAGRATGSELPVVHRKQYLPDEPGFYEASWYARGNAGFDVAEAAGVRIGFAICTEMWFLQRARVYALGGLQLLACPRATYAGSSDKWLAGGRTAAVVSGAFCLSSNFDGPAAEGTWGGTGWVIEPEEGEVLATTSAEQPFATVEIDLGVADRAKQTYPRYVDDSSIARTP